MPLAVEQEAWWQERRRAAKAAAQPCQTYPWSPNRWAHFLPYELRSRGHGRLHVDVAAMDGLQGIRVEWGRPIIVNSAYRTAEWNAATGGSLRRTLHPARRAGDRPLSHLRPCRLAGLDGAMGPPMIGALAVARLARMIGGTVNAAGDAVTDHPQTALVLVLAAGLLLWRLDAADDGRDQAQAELAALEGATTRAIEAAERAESAVMVSRALAALLEANQKDPRHAECLALDSGSRAADGLLFDED